MKRKRRKKHIGRRSWTKKRYFIGALLRHLMNYMTTRECSPKSNWKLCTSITWETLKSLIRATQTCSQMLWNTRRAWLRTRSFTTTKRGTNNWSKSSQKLTTSDERASTRINDRSRRRSKIKDRRSLLCKKLVIFSSCKTHLLSRCLLRRFKSRWRRIRKRIRLRQQSWAH